VVVVVMMMYAGRAVSRNTMSGVRSRAWNAFTSGKLHMTPTTNANTFTNVSRGALLLATLSPTQKNEFVQQLMFLRKPLRQTMPTDCISGNMRSTCAHTSRLLEFCW
jgi:hypothetical protein